MISLIYGPLFLDVKEDKCQISVNISIIKIKKISNLTINVRVSEFNYNKN